ncbi:MAG TPA: TonB-dependent receptor [Oceanospirillales bacterium]|nr:TonB-dependent receptor [Oceanospirillales bacterium]
MKKRPQQLHHAIKTALYGGLLTSLLFAPNVNAETKKPEGTLIHTTVDKQGFPIIIIERGELLASGITDVGQLLQRLPYFNGSPKGTNTNNGGNGSVSVDLRGMGTAQTLVLIDGHRSIDDGDFQSIPAAMIEKVEISKQGSSRYGAGAVAGVVNIITRSDFNGAEVDFSIHDSFSSKNNEVKQGSLVFGNAIEQGGFTFGIQYEDQRATLQSDTPYEFLQDSFIIVDPDNYTGFDPNASTINRFGSRRIPCGVFNLASGGSALTVDGLNPGAGDCGAPGRSLTPADFRPLNAGFFDPNNDTYNFAPPNFIQTPYEKTNVFFNGHRDLAGVEIFTSFRYNHRTSSQQLAPLPYDSNFDPAAPLAGGEGSGISSDNVFNPFGEDITRVRRRMLEIGRGSSQDIQQYQSLLGVRGTFGASDWRWQASYNFGYRVNINENRGQFFGSRLALALGPSFFDSNGIATCGTPDAPITGCVPLNLFGGPGTVTPEMLSYISGTFTDTSRSKLDVFNASITGALFELPAGTVNSELTVEYRYQSLAWAPDSAALVGNSTLNTDSAISGSYDVSSVVGAVNIPLINSENRGKLTLDLAVRHDDYSTSGANNTFQGALLYQARDNLSISANFSEVFSEPSIRQLFQPQEVFFPTFADPCAMTRFQNLTPQQQAMCVALGAPPGGAFEFDTQVRVLIGGNPQLKPTTGHSKSLGLNWSPSAIPKLNIDIDWWKISMGSGITTLSFTETVLSCLNSGDVNSSQCDRVQRRGSGFPFIIFGTQSTAVNTANLTSEGIDLTMQQSYDSLYGHFELALQYSRLLKNNRQNFNNADISSLDGRFTRASRQLDFNDVNEAFIKDKALLSINWTYGDWSIAYHLQYYSGLDADLQFFDARNLVENGGLRNKITQDIAAQSYSDIALSYALPWQQTKLTVGINNLLDRDPPFIESASSNIGTEAGTYRAFGRSWFIKWNSRF